MALEAIAFSQGTLSSGSSLTDLFNYDFGNLLLDFDDDILCMEFENLEENVNLEIKEEEVVVEKKKRRRTRKSTKNKEEVENQRMTHIAVERNRRRLMNEHLAALRSLMPPGYVQRGDQASIVGGAINFVKELEQLLQTLEAKKRMKHMQEFDSSASQTDPIETILKNKSSVADVEVTMTESHANLKILLKKRPTQLLKLVARLQNLRYTVLHLNVTTTVDHIVSYSFCLKVEDDCRFGSGDDIVTLVTQMVEEIEEFVCN